MNELTFKIRKISSGWFDVSFILNKEKLNICASNAWGNDAPKHKRDKYEGNWMPFPLEELRQLKAAVG